MSNYERPVKTNAFDEDIKNYTIQDIYDLLNITSTNPTDTQINMAIDNLSSKMKKEGNYDIVHFLSAARIKVIQELRDNQFHKTFAIQKDQDEGDEDNEEVQEDEGEDNEEEDEQEEEYDENQEEEEENPDVIEEEYGNYNNMNDNFILKNQGINAIYKTNPEPYEKDENTYGYVNRDDEGNQDDIKEIGEDELFSDEKNGNFIPNNAYEVPFVKGTINPLLASTVKRSIIVDSYYRQSPLDTNNTSFLFNLSHELKYVISMQLYSVQIPTTWNNIDPLLGNSKFEINKNGTIATYDIPAGYYTSTSLIAVLNNFDPQIVFDFNPLSRIQVTNNSGMPASLIFYQQTGTQLGASVNKNLGWTLGFRLPIINLPDANPVIGVQGDLSGSKYFILAIDDFNNNHVNDFLVSSSSANSQNDIFAIIPLANIQPPIPYIDYDSNIDIFKRTYFGPVNLSKLKITLYDDRGNIVNLNQQDWSFTLIVEQMYKN